MSTAESKLREVADLLYVVGLKAYEVLKSPDLELHYPREVTPNYETELQQVAASAIFALVDLAMQKGQSEEAANFATMQAIGLERQRQDELFGSMIFFYLCHLFYGQYY